MDSQRKRGPRKNRQQMDGNNGETNRHKQKRWKKWPNLFNRRVLFSSIEHLSTTCIRSPLPSSSLKDAFLLSLFSFCEAKFRKRPHSSCQGRSKISSEGNSEMERLRRLWAASCNGCLDGYSYGLLAILLCLIAVSSTKNPEMLQNKH